MKNLVTKILVPAFVGALSLSPAYAGMEDDPTELKLMLDKFEVGRTGGNTVMAWEGGLWIGKDLNKLWIMSDGERAAGETEGTENRLLYSRAISPFWDLQAGLRHDTVPGESRDYLNLGIHGLAPYYFETDANISFGENEQVKLNASFEYEMMLTQKLVLSPEIEFNAYAKDDAAMGVGSGLSDIEAGLRLRYEIKREFAPYIGVNWAKKFGGTADLARDEGEDTSETMFVIGVRAWY
ncbi:MAG: copper resistance protein B [Cocleimonas sp.]|nr:copper resistance protein B [Cocleimonas sp.]